MAENQKENQQQLKVKELQEITSRIDKYGGFDIVETTVKGVENLNPKKKARKEIFLTESQYKEDRANLKRRLELWAELLSSTEDLGEMVNNCEEKSVAAAENLNKNLKKAVDASKDLETSYRTVALFYRNTESDKLKNVSILNAAQEQLTDLDVTTFIDTISEEFKQAYDRLDLRENYSMLVVPGYLGSNKVIEKWAKIAHDNKVMMLTDFRNLDTPDDVMDLFQSAKSLRW